MLTSLIHEARFWPHLWRRRLRDSWRYRVREHLGFVLLLALVIAAVACGIYLAYRDGTSIEPAQIEAVQHDEARLRQRADDLECLAENVYFEARGEPLAGQYAVAQVTLNRTHARNFPRTICAVVHETRWDPVRRRHTADFSWTELRAPVPEDEAAWKQAMAVANAVYDDLVPPLVPEALYYHATNVRPDWARGRRAIGTIGNHIFYR
jgi:spore germination cell wall hydrolase CwlJ-like protein